MKRNKCNSHTSRHSGKVELKQNNNNHNNNIDNVNNHLMLYIMSNKILLTTQKWSKDRRVRIII